MCALLYNSVITWVCTNVKRQWKASEYLHSQFSHLKNAYLCQSPTLLTPHLNSLDQDLYLDQHQIAHTHKYQSPSYSLIIFFPSRFINYSLKVNKKVDNRITSSVEFNQIHDMCSKIIQNQFRNSSKCCKWLSDITLHVALVTPLTETKCFLLNGLYQILQRSLCCSSFTFQCLLNVFNHPGSAFRIHLIQNQSIKKKVSRVTRRYSCFSSNKIKNPPHSV